MPKLEEIAYGGFYERTKRLGLDGLLNEVRQALSGFDLRVLEQRDSNGGAALRVLIDEQFRKATGWTKVQSGDIDWTKCHRANGIQVCLGVEIQVSARSDMLVVDIIHIRKALVEGKIDAGVLAVPSDRLGVFLVDRGPRMSDAKKHVDFAKATDLPLLLIGLTHDGPGPALPKRQRRSVDDDSE